MGEIEKFPKNPITEFIKFLFIHIIKVSQDLFRAKDNIPFKELFIDAFSVIQKTGFFFLLNVLAFIVFAFLPQGKDVIFIISEEVGVEHRYGNLIWLLVGVLFWSIISEFACRYAVYVSDNSGKSISEERVRWKKALQSVTAQLALMTPFFIVMLAFFINYINDDSLKSMGRKLGFGIPVILLYFLLNLIVKIYFHNNPSKTVRPEESHSKNNSSEKRLKNRLQRWLFLPEKEFNWCKKLYGIYNDFVFSIRKPENFKGQEEKDFFEFCEHFLTLSDEERNKFPKDKNKIFQYSGVPDEFQFREFTAEEENKEGLNKQEREEAEIKEKAGSYRWVFRIPNTYYKHLHKQVFFVCTLSLLIFFTISFLKLEWYENIGAPGLLVLAFACWTGIYVGILFLDYAVFRSYVEKTLFKRVIGNIPLRVVLLLWLVVLSFVSHNHPIRFNNVQSTDTRPELTEHFRKWLDNYIKNGKNNCYEKDGTHFYPIVFVCAEGGALRTGAYTAMLLSCLQDSLTFSNKCDLKQSICCFSGVSGGSLGLSFFNSITYLSKKKELSNDTLSKITKKFFSKDFLAPVLGKMFYGEIINSLIPVTFRRFDRAIALEEIWESSYRGIIDSKSQNYFAGDCRTLFNATQQGPALFINTTEIETGRQCWISNVKTNTDIFLDKEHDLLAYKIKNGINYSTMINFSTRFPLISPAGCLEEDKTKGWHYVDGGYYENSGTGTMIEIYKVLQPIFKEYARKNIFIKPYALVLRFGTDKGSNDGNMSSGNAITEIMAGIYNVRGGRTEYSVKELQRLIKMDNPSGFIQLCLEEDGNKVPMNWVLSEKSLDNIKYDITQKWIGRNKNELGKLFAIDKNCRGSNLCKGGLCCPDTAKNNKQSVKND